MADNAAIAKMEFLVSNWLAVASKKPLTAKQQAALVTDLKTLAADLAALPKVTLAGVAPAPATLAAAPGLRAAPTAAPPTPGLTNWAAAQLDAGWVLEAALGNLVGADTNPAPGAAKALGFNGVIGTGTASGQIYATFTDGVLGVYGPVNPGAGPGGFKTLFGLAPGIDKDAPYTGPGAVRP
jgi:hypothetical protein